MPFGLAIEEDGIIVVVELEVKAQKFLAHDFGSEIVDNAISLADGQP